MRDFIKKNSTIILYVIIFICLVAIVFGIISLVNYNRQVEAQHNSIVSSNTDLPNQVAGDTNIYTPSPERTDKHSLTLEDIHSLPIPDSYVLQKIENYEITEEGRHDYEADLSDTELLIPQWMDIDTEELLSSGLEGDKDDYKIYTLTRNVLINGDICDILYINDPVSLEFVACSVEFENVTYLYNFSY